MKTNITQHTSRILSQLTAGALALGLTATTFAQGTAFTYQGRLVEGGQPASGWYAMSFSLWDDASRGLALGQPQLEDRVAVSNGLFTVTLDFGVDPFGLSYFRGDARWLAIGVDHYKGTNYVTLVPRQPLTPTPYAMFAPASGSVPASGLTGRVPEANLPSSPTFTGTVQAAQFQGGGAGLTGVFPADNSVTSTKIVDNAVAAVDLASEAASLHKVSGGHLTVDADGNVGLGMSTPGFPLNFASATGDKISLYGTGTNHYGFGIQSGLLQIHGSAIGADIAFGYGPSASFTEQMRIKGSGNVGIGTAAPAYPLDVRADQAVGRFLSTNAAEISVLVLGNTAVTARSLGAINFNSSSGNPGQISYATNTGLTFNAGGAERLRITPDGGVGIGTSDPSGAALNVVGTVRATQFQGGGAGLTGIAPADNSVTSAKIVDLAVATVDLANNAVTSAKILDGTVAAVDLASEEASLNKVSGGHMTVTPAGNLGLGTATPDWPLDVRAEEAVGRFLSTSSAYVSFLELGNTAASASLLGAINFSTTASTSGTPPGQIAYDRTDGLTFRAGLAERVRITPEGNLGLGTAAPAWPLDVRAGQAVGRFLSTNGPSVAFLELGNTVASAPLLGAINFNNSSNTTPGQIAYSPTAGLSFRAGGSERLQITPAGSVVVGDGGSLNLYSRSGSSTLNLYGDSGGAGFLSVRNSTGLPRVSLDGESTGTGFNGGEISVFGGNGIETIEILGTADAANTGGQIVFKQGNGTTSVQIDGEVGTAGGGYMRLYKGNGTAGITLQAQDGNGDACITTQVIEITGGSDLSERFDVKPTTLAPTPGMLVSIDPEQPGRLAVSTRAYDRTVAGVISGAGGVKSGMLMSQHGSVASGQHPVALSGRTYCLVDAGGATIEPGDLITTSDTPGHGMKASDPTRAQGAIIGKAMTRLETGCGLVLVLVTLQ